MIRVAILASGTGTNALKLIEAAKLLTRVSIELVIVDQMQAPLIQTLKDSESGLNLQMILQDQSLKGSDRRKEHEKRVLQVLHAENIQYIFLAGYMRILSAEFVSQFHNRLINIHPSLLPKFPGLHAYEQAFAAKESHSGVTVHFVDEGVDTGAIIAQAQFPRLDSDSITDFIARGKSLEWNLYPEVLKRLDRDGKL